MKTKVQLALDELWAGIITHFYYDLLNHRLTFGVMVTKNVEVTTYKVSIDEIVSIIFDDPSSEEYANYDWEIMEVSAFHYSLDSKFAYRICFPASDNGQEVERTGSFNLLLEMFSAEIYIRAKRLQINEKTFQLL